MPGLFAFYSHLDVGSLIITSPELTIIRIACGEALRQSES
jgi:hypothetical protein